MSSMKVPPHRMSNGELLLSVENNPMASATERELAKRLTDALEYIQHVTEFLEANDLIEEVGVTLQ